MVEGIRRLNERRSIHSLVRDLLLFATSTLAANTSSGCRWSRGTLSANLPDAPQAILESSPWRWGASSAKLRDNAIVALHICARLLVHTARHWGILESAGDITEQDIIRVANEPARSIRSAKQRRSVIRPGTQSEERFHGELYLYIFGTNEDIRRGRLSKDKVQGWRSAFMLARYKEHVLGNA
jgi:hypothetical protein